ncbi:MAG: hypothetical protein NTW06_00780 [Candidatus Falkowbacteria bacterium]|nr:hypothetical protein [Candidatus Falkowbacteria bacterium]
MRIKGKEDSREQLEHLKKMFKMIEQIIANPRGIRFQDRSEKTVAWLSQIVFRGVVQIEKGSEQMTDIATTKETCQFPAAAIGKARQEVEKLKRAIELLMAVKLK